MKTKMRSRGAQVPPYIGCAQEQLSVPGVLSLLFSYLILIPSKPSQTFPKTFPKPFPKPPQINIFLLFFPIVFLCLFCIDFLRIFCWFLMLRNLKNRAPVEAKRLFLQNRRFRFKSKNLSKNHRFSTSQNQWKIQKNSEKNVFENMLAFNIDF